MCICIFVYVYVYKEVIISLSMTNQQDRLERINTISKLIFKCGEYGADEKFLISEFQLRTGLRDEKIKEYINALISSGKVERDGELLKAVKVVGEVENE